MGGICNLFSLKSLLQFITFWLSKLGLCCYIDEPVSPPEPDVPKTLSLAAIFFALFIIHQMAELLDADISCFGPWSVCGSFVSFLRSIPKQVLHVLTCTSLVTGWDMMITSPVTSSILSKAEDEENCDDKVKSEEEDLLESFVIFTDDEIREAIENTKSDDKETETETNSQELLGSPKNEASDAESSTSEKTDVEDDTQIEQEVKEDLTSDTNDEGKHEEEEETCDTTEQNTEQPLTERSVTNYKKLEETVEKATKPESEKEVKVKDLDKFGENIVPTPSRPVTFNTIQNILKFRSAIQGVIDDMVSEELELLVMECFSTELQFADVVEKYEHLMPLNKYCAQMDDLSDQKHDHISELSNLARTSNILWNRAIDYKQQSEEQEDMVKTLRRGNRAILNELTALKQHRAALQQDVGDIPRKFWQRVEQGFKPDQ